MAGPLLVGIDAGTTGIRALVFTPDGEVVAQAGRTVPLERPRPGWAQHDPQALWEATCAALREATGQLERPGRIAGVAAASVGEAFVAIDPDGQPVGPRDRLVRRAAAGRARLADPGDRPASGCTPFAACRPIRPSRSASFSG